MSPYKHSANGKPVHVQVTTKRLSTGFVSPCLVSRLLTSCCSEHPLLPQELVFEIQQFAQSDFARRYFSTHRQGLIFKRRIPVEKMMTWQKVVLSSPFLPNTHISSTGSLNISTPRA